MAAYVELFMDQGTTFNNVINITDDMTNAPINVSGYVIRSQMRTSYFSSNVTANISCFVADAANGEIYLSVPSANTAKIKPGRYLFDVLATDTSNTVSRVLEGIITVTGSVTR